jgi:probable rRNA maturation factor
MPRAEKSAPLILKLRIFKAHPEYRIGVRRMREAAQRMLQTEGWDFNVQVIVADDLELQRLHAQFLHDDTPTDVITFPGDPADGHPAEIYISLDQARAQAEESGEPIARALDRLMIHGLLHLGGWNDATDTQRARMIEYGERYLD